MKNKLQKGWHWVYCFMCGEKIGKVVHYGGTKKLKKCGYCQEIPHYCLKCFETK